MELLISILMIFSKAWTLLVLSRQKWLKILIKKNLTIQNYHKTHNTAKLIMKDIQIQLIIHIQALLQAILMEFHHRHPLLHHHLTWGDQWCYHLLLHHHLLHHHHHQNQVLYLLPHPHLLRPHHHHHQNLVLFRHHLHHHLLQVALRTHNHLPHQFLQVAEVIN